MVGWVSVSRIKWVMNNKMHQHDINPKEFYFTLCADGSGVIVNNNQILTDFKDERELDEKLTFLQKGGDIDDIGPGKIVPKSKKDKQESRKVHTMDYSGSNTNLFGMGRVLIPSIDS